MFMIVLNIGYSQSEKKGTISFDKSSYHYFGLQGNELLRELLSFGGSRPAIDNPYLLIYNVNVGEKQSGLNVGFGMNTRKQTASDDNFESETKFKTIDWRVGYERKFQIGKRFITSWGADFLLSWENDITTTKNFDPDGDLDFESKLETRGLTWGVGPRFTLGYFINDKILLMTEATYYFRSGWTEDISDFTIPGSPNLDNEEIVEQNHSEFTFTPPIVIYLVVRI